MSAEDPATAERRRRFAEEARAERPDLALLCLLLGAEAARPVPGDADPHGIDAAQIELDRLAGLLPYGARGPREWASALAELLGERCGFAGSSQDYQRLDSSVLQQVPRRRRGLPILLSVVWIEVARRAGAPVYGLSLPGHYVVGFGDPAERVLADPFAGGAPLSGEDAELMVAGATGAPPSATTQVPARPLETALRILNNIRAWAAARPSVRMSRCGRSTCPCCCPRTPRGSATSGRSSSCSAGSSCAGRRRWTSTRRSSTASSRRPPRRSATAPRPPGRC